MELYNYPLIVQWVKTDSHICSGYNNLNRYEKSWTFADQRLMSDSQDMLFEKEYQHL